MFMLKKILTPFLLPPGVFIISSIFSGAWLLYKKKWKASIITLSFGCLAWALSIAPISYIMFRGLESEYRIPKNTKGDVIILLGAPPDGSLFRFVTAARLQKMLDIPIIMSGANKASKLKGSFAIRFLIDLGVPAEKIIEEDKSRDTIENAKFTRNICARLGFTEPIVVTSAYHMKRAIMSFEKVGLKVVPFPSDFKSWQGKHFRWNEYFPGDFREASIAISEYMGIVYYKFAY